MQKGKQHAYCSQHACLPRRWRLAAASFATSNAFKAARSRRFPPIRRSYLLLQQLPTGHRPVLVILAALIAPSPSPAAVSEPARQHRTALSRPLARSVGSLCASQARPAPRRPAPGNQAEAEAAAAALERVCRRGAQTTTCQPRDQVPAEAVGGAGRGARRRLWRGVGRGGGGAQQSAVGSRLVLVLGLPACLPWGFRATGGAT